MDQNGKGQAVALNSQKQVAIISVTENRQQQSEEISLKK